MSYSRLVESFSDKFPTRGTPFDKTPPRTTSCSFARAVSASDQGVSHTTWRDPGHEHFCYDTWRAGSPCHASAPADSTCGQLAPTEALNVALFSRAAIKSPSHPTLQHTNFTRGTQVPPTTSSCLRLGLNMAGSSCARTS
jgi:hypothetical protein